MNEPMEEAHDYVTLLVSISSTSDRFVSSPFGVTVEQLFFSFFCAY
jgi:hypothetical protein